MRFLSSGSGTPCAKICASSSLSSSSATVLLGDDGDDESSSSSASTSRNLGGGKGGGGGAAAGTGILSTRAIGASCGGVEAVLSLHSGPARNSSRYSSKSRTSIVVASANSATERMMFS